MKIDTWTILRRDARSVAETIEYIEIIRANTDLGNFFCGMLEFLRKCPDNTIEDVIRTEAFMMASPRWGPAFMTGSILYAGLIFDRMTAGIVQRNYAVGLTTIPIPGVYKILQVMLHQPNLVFYSRDAIDIIVEFLLKTHRNPKAFFSQENVLKHIPYDTDLTGAANPDHEDIDEETGQPKILTGGRYYQHKTYRLPNEGSKFDFAKLSEVALWPDSKIIRWLNEQSKAGDQTKFSDITIDMAFDAIKELGISWGVKSEAWDIKDPSEGMVYLIEDLYNRHSNVPDLEEHYSMLCSFACHMIHLYDLHPDAKRIYEIDHTIRKALNLPHDAPEFLPSPIQQGAT